MEIGVVAPGRPMSGGKVEAAAAATAAAENQHVSRL